MKVCIDNQREKCKIWLKKMYIYIKDSGTQIYGFLLIYPYKQRDLMTACTAEKALSMRGRCLFAGVKCDIWKLKGGGENRETQMVVVP